MKDIDKIVIANQDPKTNSSIVRMLTESGFSGSIKCTVNAGHALLYLQQLSLEGKLYRSKVLVLLNLDTPIVNGLEFLASFHESSSIQKENIKLIVLTDDMDCDIVHKSKQRGANIFLPFSFSIADLDEKLYGSTKPAEKKRKPSKIKTSNGTFARI